MFTELTPESLRQFRALYYALASDVSHSVLLDSCGWEGNTGGFYMMGFGAETVVQLHGHQLSVNGQPAAEIPHKAALWEALQELTPLPGSESSSFPFEDGWIGTLGYELNHLLEPSVPFRASENPMGELTLVRFRHRILWEPGKGRFELRSPDAVWKQQVARWLQSPPPASPPQGEGAPLGQAPTASLSQEAFEARVREIQEQIRAGNLYQANLSMRFELTDVPSSELFALYEALVTRNPSPFSGVLWTPEGVVLSNSPERLVKLTANTRLLETRPIAGTRGRGRTEAEEQAIAQTLQTDIKEQAEHMMLVDLERNDLGRVSTPGSVHVPELGVLERYSHVTHIVSQVEGRLAPHKTPWDVLDALFPGGTITGCPKVRCMTVLQALEPVPRGLYTGSLGYLDSRGNLDFNILIRSLFHWPNQRLHFHAGAGIVADSVPAWEYRECHRKAEVIQGVLSHDHPPVCPS